MEIKEILTNRIIRERFRLALEKIKEESQKIFTGALHVSCETSCCKVVLHLFKKTESRKQLLGIIPYKGIRKEIIAWLILEDGQAVCGVREPVIYNVVKENITKTFEDMREKTNIKNLTFKQDF